jgi:hypothetical protein
MSRFGAALIINRPAEAATLPYWGGGSSPTKIYARTLEHLPLAHSPQNFSPGWIAAPHFGQEGSQRCPAISTEFAVLEVIAATFRTAHLSLMSV